MPVSNKLTWVNENGEKLEVEFGAEAKNVDVGGKTLPTVISTLQSASDKSLKYKGACDSTKSINDYNTDDSMGIWQIGAGSTPSDMPIGRVANENVLLIVTKAYGSGTYCKQELVYTVQNIILTRIYSTEWQSWSFGATTGTDSKTGNKFVTFKAGSKGEMQESEYSPDMFLRSDAENVNGAFGKLTVAYPYMSPETAANEFSGGAYYDARAIDGTGWQPSYAADGQGGDCNLVGDFDTTQPYRIAVDEKIMLPEAFNKVHYYSDVSNGFKFRVAIIADIVRDTKSRDLISLFNGNLTVNRRGMNGIRIVCKQGTNGTVLKTSDFITETGLMAIALEGSNNSGILTLTVLPLNTDFTVAKSAITVTTELTASAYIGTQNASANFAMYASGTTTDVYSMYLETATGTKTLSEDTMGTIIESMRVMMEQSQSDVASIDYVQNALARQQGKCDTQSLKNINIKTVIKSGIYNVDVATCTGLPEDIDDSNCGATLIVSEIGLRDRAAYTNQYLITNSAGQEECTKIYACELFGDNLDYPWTLVATTTAVKLTQYSTTPQRIGTWIDGTPIWRVAFDKDADLSSSDYYTSDDKKINISVSKIVSVKDSNNLAVTDGQVFLRVGKPCVIDDQMTSRNNQSWEYTTAYPKSHDGFYGWVEFVAPADNLK